MSSNVFVLFIKLSIFFQCDNYKKTCILSQCLLFKQICTKTEYRCGYIGAQVTAKMPPSKNISSNKSDIHMTCRHATTLQWWYSWNTWYTIINPYPATTTAKSMSHNNCYLRHVQNFCSCRMMFPGKPAPPLQYNHATNNHIHQSKITTQYSNRPGNRFRLGNY